MEYIEIRIKDLTGEIRDIITWYLGDAGFESFSEDGADLLAYVNKSAYDRQQVAGIVQNFQKDFSEQEIPEQNWNEEWEKNFQPVTIAGRCHVRAPFHPHVEGIEHEIVIMPKMSFGTAHHETTSGMITLMLDLDMKGKTVLDMGCGTGILAILAEQLGAEAILAIDNDSWAYENALENVERNNCTRITVMEGGKEKISGHFGVIIANINRNILLDQISSYADAAAPGAVLLMSGFYEEDLPVIRASAEENGFQYLAHLSSNRWVAASFTK
jgi:ribosomal protein L11 methyltransferase